MLVAGRRDTEHDLNANGDYGSRKATETVDVTEGLLLLFCRLSPISLPSDSDLSLSLANHLPSFAQVSQGECVGREGGGGL